MDYEQKYNEALNRAKSIYGENPVDSERSKACQIIFPELRESEDERIRKELIIELQSWEGIPESKRKQYIAYLEKQKERNEKYWTEEEIEPIISDYLTGREHYGGMIGRLRCLRPKQKEQKPVEPNDINVKKMIDTYRCTEEYDKDGNRKGTPILCMVRAYEQGIRDVLKIVKQQPAEWSEEDEKQIAQIERIVKNAGCAKMLQDKIHNWLKSLRPKPQILEDWTSEDDELLADVLGCITLVQTYKACGDLNEFKMGHTGEELRSFVRSLKSRPRKQPSWKPSEEQMNELDKARRFIPYNCYILESLYEQLKAL